MSRKRTTPPPIMTTPALRDAHYRTFWGTTRPAYEPRTCPHGNGLPVHCPVEGCRERCAFNGVVLGQARKELGL